MKSCLCIFVKGSKSNHLPYESTFVKGSKSNHLPYESTDTHLPYESTDTHLPYESTDTHLLTYSGVAFLDSWHEYSTLYVDDICT
jgi:hypothetical protein